MKKLFILELLIMFGAFFSAQSQTKTIFLNAEKHKNTTTLCEGEFYDNSKNGNYATNIDYWTTICPDQPSMRTKLEFDMFDIHPSDTVRIYYGTSINDPVATSQVTGLNYFQNQELEGKQISPPISDQSGCLTFRLQSNRIEVAKGWKARISCEAICQDVYVALAPTFTKYDTNGNKSTRPVRDDIDFDTVKVANAASGYNFTRVNELGVVEYYRIDTIKFKAIDICEGDSVVLKADPQFPQQDFAYHQTPENCIYVWGFGDSDAAYDTVYYNPTISHKWLKVSGYDLNLYIKDTSYGGCIAKNTINARVRIARNPIKMENNIPDMCSGDNQPVRVDYSGTATVVLDSMHINQTQREIFETRKFIPDGGATPAGNATYETSITFASFSPGATLSNGKEISDICINMEHSSVGDLGIELTCPDNKSVTLKYNTKQKTIAQNAFLGKPAGSVKYGYLTASAKDNATKITDTTKNEIGECWQYCWSNIYLKNKQGVLNGLSPNIIRNYSLSKDGVAFVNNTIDSTHFWSVSDTLQLSSTIPADTIHIYQGTVFAAKGNDTIFSSTGAITPFTSGDAVTIQNGDSYAAISTGKEFLFHETYDTNQYNIGEDMQQSMPIIENSATFPPNFGDTVKLHINNITIYKDGITTIPGYGATFKINSATSVTVNDGTEQTLSADSIILITTHKQEYRPYKNDVYKAQYGDYIRTTSYIYTRDTIISEGDTSQFLQTPKQNVTGNTAYSTTPSQAYIDATTPDLNGFNNLIGCPLNGTWTIKVTDDMNKDNGWICGWWIDINLSAATDWTYSVPIDTVVWGGPYITKSQSTSAIIAPPISANGNFTYNVKVIDDFGCAWPATTNISIVGTPQVKLGKDKEICEGQSVTLDAGNPGASRYDWEPTGDTTQTIKITPAENDFGSKTYVAMVTNNNGKLFCYGYDTIKVNIHPGATASFSSDTYPLEGCEPYSFQLLSTSSEAEKYEWKLGEYTSTEANPKFTFPAGVYDLNMKVTSKYGCVDSIHYDNAVNVFASLAADFNWKPANPYASNPSVTMINLTEPNDEVNNRYRWEIQTNKFNPMDVENVFGRTPYYIWAAQNGENIAGDYNITLDAYSYNVAPSGKIYECHDTISKVITIINDNIIFPTVVTPNGDGINDIFEIHNLLEGQAYPDNELTIYNRYGKRIYFMQDIRSPEQFWDPAQTKSPTGTYFYHFVAKGPIKNVEFNGSVEVLSD